MQACAWSCIHLTMHGAPPMGHGHTPCCTWAVCATESSVVCTLKLLLTCVLCMHCASEEGLHRAAACALAMPAICTTRARQHPRQHMCTNGQPAGAYMSWLCTPCALSQHTTCKCHAYGTCKYQARYMDTRPTHDAVVQEPLHEHGASRVSAEQQPSQSDPADSPGSCA
jgi:hypothetical protein